MKTNFILLLMFFGCIGFPVFSQVTVDLWEEQIPGNNELPAVESLERNGTWYLNVSHPTLTIYSPEKEKNTGMAVIICPGGGYTGLSFQNEGTQVAEWFREQGITAVILKYRMPNGHKDIPLSDAWQAIRYIRKNAGQLNVHPSKVGIIGYSAGGHLAATASNHFSFEGIHTRPDFSILVYPVITMEVLTHGGSRKNLLGENPSVEDIHRFSNEKQVSVNTPPTLLLLSDDDRVVLPQNSIDYYSALKRNKIPAAMYIFPEGGHGWGMNKAFKYHNDMLSLIKRWLETLPL